MVQQSTTNCLPHQEQSVRVVVSCRRRCRYKDRLASLLSGPSSQCCPAVQPRNRRSSTSVPGLSRSKVFPLATISRPESAGPNRRPNGEFCPATSALAHFTNDKVVPISRKDKKNSICRQAYAEFFTIRRLAFHEVETCRLQIQ